MNARHFTLGRVALLAGAAIASGCSDNNNSSAPPTVTFSSPAAAAAINYGQSLTLSWTSTNAASCTASTVSGGGSFSGSQSITGSASVAPAPSAFPASVSYTLSCTGPGGTTSATSPTITVNPNILSTLSTFSTIGSTYDTAAGGFNPYGLAIAPASQGLISKGDLIVCNFNNNSPFPGGTQGSGTTIVGLHPTPAANAGGNPYSIANSAELQGCNALALLPDDSISASAFGPNLNPLVSASGVVNNPFAADSFGQPWGEAYVPANASQPLPALYISNVSGTIDRITLNESGSGDTQAGFTEIAAGFCGSGVPGAIFAPSGLTYDPSIDTLYIVDTSSYSVVAFAKVSAIGQDGVVVNGNCSAAGGATPTPQPTFSGPSGSSATVIASGGQFNAPISAALLSDGDLVVSNGDINNPPVTNLAFEISPALGFVGAPVQFDTGNPGALFGMAATVDANGNQLIYFNDDNLAGSNNFNTVNLLSK